MTPLSNTTASIIIKNWNAYEYLETTLNCLKENTPGKDYELIICDDKSRQDVIDKLVKIDAKLVLNRDAKVGAPGVGNQGFLISSGEYLAFLDSDVLLPKNWLSDLICELNDLKGDIITPRKQVGLVHPSNGLPLEKVWNNIKSKHSNLSPMEQFKLYSGNMDINTFSNAVMEEAQPEATIIESPPFFLGFCCIVAKKETISKCGGFVNKPFFLYGGEDADLCWRIGKQGGKVIISGRVHMHHFEHSSVNINEMNFIKEIEKNNEILFPAWKTEIDSFITRERKKGMTIKAIADKHGLLKRYIAWRSDTTE